MSRFTTLTIVGVLTALLLAAVAPAADPKRYREYYKIFNRGNSLIPGDDTRWVPQGLAYWPDKDALVISYYDGDHAKNSRIAVIDRASGKRQKIIELDEKGHVGGLGMSANFLWVASSGTLSAYPEAVLEATVDGGKMAPVHKYKPRATSYLFVAGNDLWLGDFKGSTAYHYALDGAERPSFDNRTLPTPSKVQGMAISKGKVIWSRSFGRNEDSRLDVRTPSGKGLNAIVAPNMSEGLAIARGKLHVLYESGSAVYKDADYRVKTVHHGPVSKLAG